LHLRIDNADARLTPLGERVGLVSPERAARFQVKEEQKGRLRRGLLSRRMDAMLRRPEVRLSVDLATEVLGGVPVRGVIDTVETEIKYAGYLDQQDRHVQRLRDSERRPLPDDLVFSAIPGLSREVAERLTRGRPSTLGQAGRIPGVTPAAVAILDIYLSSHAD
jgi:tRNA uridine 5-carboxymethylaminomethyl modification enzyme